MDYPIFLPQITSATQIACGYRDIGRSFTAAPCKPQNPPQRIIPIPLCTYFSLRLQNTSPCLFRFPQEQENLSFSRVIALATFQHLWPGSPNEFQEKSDFQTFDHTTQILIGFSG
ncbi:hypothetical protein AVEN_53332-1 [Araneus ventricosus]|uniref:Uncharacterized protein n=1 Tax=Araneus ventricosus TaxID=182803 RepID=A0A4Y2ACD2_ARAVE|nr:hypothetical protein AVEN_53332-1 [Araneus ventricosus]